jgi:hypothetical protein
VVAAVAPAVDRTTGLGVVRVTLNLTSGAAPPVGVTGTARVAVGAPREAIVVPSRALRRAIGAYAEIVICGADRRAHVVTVERGVSLEDVTEVRVRADAGAGAPGSGGRSNGGDAVRAAVPRLAGSAPALAPGTLVAIEPVLGLGDDDPIERSP